MVHKCDPHKPTHCSIKWIHIHSYPLLYSLGTISCFIDDFKILSFAIILYILFQVSLLHLFIGLQSVISFFFFTAQNSVLNGKHQHYYEQPINHSKCLYFLHMW